ncbi:MAG: hypothetical protein Q8N99_00515 [Nanoarchaeota archaeon]|nr:hypothetical protein [Nanoarchaeota archaeon]
MTIVIDASSIILLAKIDLLEKLIERNPLIIPEKVYIEVVKGKEKGMLDAFILERLVNEKKIKIEKVEKIAYEEVWKLFGLWAGEAEVLALALKNNIPIITDDKKCLNRAKAAGVSCITSLDVIIALLKNKHINKEQAKKSLEKLENYGWYKKNIIKLYKEKIK